MATRKQKGLGRGLDALLGNDATALDAIDPKSKGGPSILNIPTQQLVAGKYQPRTQMDDDAIASLASSIAQQGIMQPLIVREVHKDGIPKYEVIAGERRLRAAQKVGLPDVPVIIKDVDDEQAAIMALIENIQREDLNPLEEARALKRLLEEFALTHEQIAETVGRSRSATSNLLRLLNLAQPVQEMLIQNKLEMGHARALLSLEAAQQIQVAMHVHAKALSVRQTEQLVAKGSNLSRGDGPTLPKQSPDALRMQERLCDHLGTAVLLKASSKGKGQLVMQFHDWEHFHGLLEKLGMSNLIKED